MKIALRHDVLIKYSKESAKFCTREPFTLSKLNRDDLSFIEKITNGLNTNESIPNKHKKILKILKDKKLIILVKNEIDRNALWESHFNMKDSLKNKSVFIIGCGGTGSIIADQLARSGLKSIGLMDGACFDSPDLNRQFIFKKRDLNKNKAELLKKYIETETDTVVVEYYNQNLTWDNLNIIKNKYDLFINCADTPIFEIQKMTLKLSELTDTPILYGSVGIKDYVIGPLIENKSQRTLHLNKILAEEANFPKTRIIKASHPLINTQAAVEISIKAYEFLSHSEELFFNKIFVH